MPESPLLQMCAISKRFGATQALCDVSFDVRAGEVMALVGENGAGKSTLMKILSGAISPDSGTIEVGGERFAPGDPHQARAAGVAMIYQELNLAPHLSVEDNVMLGQESGRFGVLWRAVQRPRVVEALRRLGHADLPLSVEVENLSVAQGQLVEIARALVMDARVIVFDEPTSSLARTDVERLFQVIDRLKRSGIAVVYISHFLEEVRRTCDRYTVLRDGRVAGSGELAGAAEAQIVAQMVGRSVTEFFPTVQHTPGETLLSITGLSGVRFPRSVSLDVRRGEILGIAGLVGAGRTELLRCIFGLDKVRTGAVRIAGVEPAAHPQARIRAGIGLVSEDRKGEGLAQQRSIADNLTYSRMGPYTRFGWLNLGRRDAAARQWTGRLRVKARNVHQEVGELSGGNQQKVAIARVLHQQADVLLLDEPTRGIDVGTKADVYRLMGEAAAEGKAVVFVSSYWNELLAVCDRVAVMGRGRLLGVRPAAEWSESTMLTTALGGEIAAEEICNAIP